MMSDDQLSRFSTDRSQLPELFEVKYADENSSR